MQVNFVSTAAIPHTKAMSAVVRNTKQTVKPLTDEFVLNSLRDELSQSMNKPEITRWVDSVINICRELNIEPKRLPISAKLPGNLTKEESHNFVTLLYKRLF